MKYLSVNSIFCRWYYAYNIYYIPENENIKIKFITDNKFLFDFRKNYEIENTHFLISLNESYVLTDWNNIRNKKSFLKVL